MTAPTEPHRTNVGVVVIGRNEGDRLRRCLQSLNASTCHVVYVDSGSTDGSIALAESHGISVVALDMSIPFTAARARNAGAHHLRNLAPRITLLQFVDGDCELNTNWIATASTLLNERQDVACVCGRLRERFPERSIYNRLCDVEWDRGTGVTDACGGIAMMKVDGFERAGRFDETLIAGEEPELCARIRAQGGVILRVSAEMAWHDADMIKFSQWWRRVRRGGYAAAEGFAMYGTKTRYARRLSRIAFWSAALPLSIAILAAFEPWWLVLSAVYPLQIVRLVWRGARIDQDAWLGAVFQVLANFSEGSGAAKYWINRLRKLPGQLIEYR